MIDLNNNELVSINGGTAPAPSSNALVNLGYAAGWHAGHAVGQTIKDVGSMVSTVGSWIFG